MIKIKLLKEITNLPMASKEGTENMKQRLQAIIDTWEDTQEGKRHKEDIATLLEPVVEGEVSHTCATHVKENLTKRNGRPINHVLLESGRVTHYDVEFSNIIVESIPIENLTVLDEAGHMHKRDIEDYAHDKNKKRVKYEHWINKNANTKSK
jgi:hypothetical protein